MRNLTPTFILDNVSRGTTSGQFDAVVLFVDTSGFTPLTIRLAEQGRDGAEILADILQAVFEPLVEAIYAHGGFIAGFAGDAFKAIFPNLGSEGSPAESYLHALAAAKQILTHMAANPSHETKYGIFDFSVRLSMADGQATWSVWASEEDNAEHHAAQKSGYTFAGTAIEEAIQGEDHADGGELVVTQSVYEALRTVQPDILSGRALTGAADGYIQVAQIADVRIAPQPVADQEAASLVHSAATARATVRATARATARATVRAMASGFYPTSLLTTQTRGEFRPVYTLFINVQRLPDPGAADDFLPLFFRLLHQYGGYLCRIGRIGASDPGGTFLLFWGAPTSYENDLSRVLHFLLELRTQINIPLRAGVTHATVYAGFIGSALREEYTCYGSSVNQAARQMGTARWGQILLDTDTARRAQDGFEVALAGHYALKGLAEEQALFALGNQQAQSEGTGFDSAFVGRAAELRQLHAAMQPILAGHFGGLFLVSGEAGIGKSRLVHEALAALSQQNVQPFLCQTDEILRESLNPLRYFLHRYFEQSPTAAEEVNKANFNAKLDILITVTTDETLHGELTRTRSFLGALVNLRWTDSLYEQLEPQLRFSNTQSALKTLILAESLRQPTLLLIEDVQWLDEDSRSMLTLLTRNVEAFPFAILATTRPTDEVRALPSEAVAHEIQLAPLSEADLTVLVKEHLGGSASKTLNALLVERAEGNPFFAEQILLYLQEQGLLIEEDGRWQFRVAEIASVLPTDLQTVLVARLDRLAQEVKQVVQTAAVLGREFSVQILSQMLQGDITLAEKVESAQDATVWAALSDLRYLFRHALLRDAAYEMQLRSQLRDLHLLAAQSYEQLFEETEEVNYYPDLVYHFLHAERPEEERRYALLAAARVAEAYANEDATSYYSRALVLTPEADLEERYYLLIKRSELYDLRGMRAEEAADLNALDELGIQLNDDLRRADVALRQAHCAEMTGSFDEMREAAERAIKLAPDTPTVTAAAIAHIAIILISQGKMEEAQSLAEEALAIARDANLRSEEAAILQKLGVLHYQLGNYADAQHCFQQSLIIFRELGNQLDEGNLLYFLGILALKANDWSTNFTEQALEIWTRLGYTHGQKVAWHGIGSGHLAAGRYSLAQNYYKRSLDIAIETNDPMSQGVIRTNMGDLARRVGLYGDAIKNYEVALRMLGSIDYPQGISTAKLAMGAAEHQRGNLDASLQYLEESLRLAEEIGAKSEMAYGSTFFGQALFYSGRLDESLSAFERSSQLHRELGHDEDALVPEIWRARIAAELGDLELARQRSDEVLALLADCAVEKIEGPGQFYFMLHETLDILNHERTNEILQLGYDLLQAIASLIGDPEMARTYLENVPAHRQIISGYEALI